MLTGTCDVFILVIIIIMILSTIKIESVAI